MSEDPGWHVTCAHGHWRHHDVVIATTLRHHASPFRTIRPVSPQKEFLPVLVGPCGLLENPQEDADSEPPWDQEKVYELVI